MKLTIYQASGGRDENDFSKLRNNIETLEETSDRFDYVEERNIFVCLEKKKPRGWKIICRYNDISLLSKIIILINKKILRPSNKLRT